MAVVIPVVAALSAAATATTAIGTFLAYSAVVATAAGALTGEKDFTRVGSLLTLGAGAYGWASGAASGASQASTAFDIADGSMEAAEAAKFARQGADAAATGSEAAATATQAAGLPQDYGADAAGNYGMDGAGEQAYSAVDGQSIGEKLTGSKGGLSEQYYNAPVDQADQAAAATEAAKNPLQDVASTMTREDIMASIQRGTDKASSILGQAWDNAGEFVSKAGEFAKKNPEMVKVGLGAIQGAYGPQAQQFRYQQSLMEQANRNANSPIRLRYMNPTTTAPGG